MTTLTNTELFFGTNAQRRLTITSAGNVGIGTSGPSEKLEVDGNLQLGTTVDAKLYMLSTGGNGNNERFYIEGYAEGGTYGGGFKLYTRDDYNIFNNAVTVNRDGLVGIGTSTPQQKLHVYEASASSQAYLIVENNRARNAAVYTKTTAGGFYAGTSIGTDTLCYQIYDDTAGERLRITSAGALLVGTTTAPTVNTGTVAVIGSSVIHSGVLGFPSPYSASVEIDIVYSNWGSNNVIGLVDVMVGLREYGATSGTAFGKVFATNAGASAGFSTFNTTDVTTSECTITAASGGNYTLRITIDPSNNTDLGSYYLNIPTGGGVNVSSISVTFV